MTLSDLASLGSFVSGLAVCITLVVLALQIRQNTREMRRSELNMTQSQLSAVRMAMISDRSLSSLVLRSGDERALDDIDRFQFDLFVEEACWAWYQMWDRSQQRIVP